MKTKPCEYCGQEFSKPGNVSNWTWQRRRFCSKRCKTLAIKSSQSNLDKGAKYRFVKGQKFSEEFKQKMRGRIPWNKGKSYHCSPKTEFKKGLIPWNKGLGNDNDVTRIRRSKEYRDWCKTLIAESNYTCVRCQKRGGRLQIHHKEMVCISPERIMDKTNVEVVCYPCHRQIHKTEQPVNQFLKAKYRTSKTPDHLPILSPKR